MSFQNTLWSALPTERETDGIHAGNKGVGDGVREENEDARISVKCGSAVHRPAARTSSEHAAITTTSRNFESMTVHCDASYLHMASHVLQQVGAQCRDVAPAWPEKPCSSM